MRKGLKDAKARRDLASVLAAIRSEFPTVTDFEREFASLCFALITCVEAA